MKKWMLAICLMFINEICQATDCFDLAGRDYKIDPDLLRAISWQESRYRVNAIGINPVTGYGSGLMQVDSQHFNELARYGIKPEHLTTDPCMGNDSNLLIVFYVQIMPDDFVMQLHRF